MTKLIRSIALVLAASLPLGVMSAVPAHAEDTGLVNYLNAQTRAQVEAYKKSLGERGKSSNPSGMGAGVRG